MLRNHRALSAVASYPAAPARRMISSRMCSSFRLRYAGVAAELELSCSTLSDTEHVRERPSRIHDAAPAARSGRDPTAARAEALDRSPALRDVGSRPACGRRGEHEQRRGRVGGPARGSMRPAARAGRGLRATRFALPRADATRRPQSPESSNKYEAVAYNSGPALLASTKLGTIQRRLAWPLRKDDTHNSRRIDYALADLNQSDVVR
eukprot:scaffold63338_cov63-Phaeocystis_antarctica.AAC.4